MRKKEEERVNVELARGIYVINSPFVLKFGLTKFNQIESVK